MNGLNIEKVTQEREGKGTEGRKQRKQHRKERRKGTERRKE